MSPRTLPSQALNNTVTRNVSVQDLLAQAQATALAALTAKVKPYKGRTLQEWQLDLTARKSLAMDWRVLPNDKETLKKYEAEIMDKAARYAKNPSKFVAGDPTQRDEYKDYTLWRVAGKLARAQYKAGKPLALLQQESDTLWARVAEAQDAIDHILSKLK